MSRQLSTRFAYLTAALLAAGCSASALPPSAASDQTTQSPPVVNTTVASAASNLTRSAPPSTDVAWQGKTDSGPMWIAVSFRVKAGRHILAGLRLDTGCKGETAALMSFVPESAEVPINADGSFNYSNEGNSASGKFSGDHDATGRWTESLGVSFQCAGKNDNTVPTAWRAAPRAG